MRKLTFAVSASLALVALTTGLPALAHDVGRHKEQLNAYILLDRTGSMSGLWDEALSSVNAYATDLGQDVARPGGATNRSVTLAVFDDQNGLQFNVLRDHAKPESWRPVTNAEASPRGMTPLYDAVARMVALAERDDPRKAVLVIMTDGEENASREVSQVQARAALDRARAHGWEVVFLGAQFANFTDAGHMGMSDARTMAVDKDGLGETMRRLAKKSADYGNATEQAPAPVTFNAEDRAAAGEAKVKQGQ